MSTPTTYFLFTEPMPTSELGRWVSVTSRFDQIIGYSALGDFFLRNSTTGQFGVLFTVDPELVPLEFNTLESFLEGYLRHPTALRTVLKEDRVAAIEQRLGPLIVGEVFIPEPYPFLGGDLSIESYAKGNVWTYAELVGSLQGVGDETGASGD